MKITALKSQENSDIIEITTDTGADFYLRLAYLVTVDADSVQPGSEFIEHQEEELLDAGLAFAAERKAEEYLARCEQCRAGLEKKLMMKNHSAQSIKAALDYLENRNLLSDRRFALSWVRSHVSTKPQGRTRLMAELCAKGIKRADCKVALDEFFEHNSESELCQRACKKAIKAGKQDDKLIRFLMDWGFSYKMIRETLSSDEELLSEQLSVEI